MKKLAIYLTMLIIASCGTINKVPVNGNISQVRYKRVELPKPKLKVYRPKEDKYSTLIDHKGRRVKKKYILFTLSDNPNHPWEPND